ncbi:hypothetical protein HXZ94_03865 [Empedobacter falsenii]|uniref:hypothetical protein n=1 Tax=Empedobacter falsenii TaxID=343874 RepID=UPI002578B775|nr:hypothetical protein [Empedobacter falsenii]MDM1297639.1 hypothetical protein [Empedobacter falsenii]MDM1317731.1 hypothetical protein [Empedobacter falsenii]
MIKKILYTLFLLMTYISGNAQSINLLETKTFSVTGTNNLTNVNFDLKAGKNRIVIVQFHLERIHSSTNGSNHPISNYDGTQYFPLTIGGKNATGVSSTYTLSSRNTNTATFTNASMTNYYFQYTLTDKGGLPTGITTFDWSKIKAPQSAGDELVVNISLFENVSPAKEYIIVGFGYSDIKHNPTTRTVTSNELTSENSLYNNPVPPGRTYAERMFFANASTSQSSAATIGQTFWAALDSNASPLSNGVLTNSGGSNSSIASNIENESDGIFSMFHYAKGFSSFPSYTLTRDNSKLINMMRVISYALNPLAKPGVTGYVYLDTDGPNSIYGQGTDKAAKYINIIGIDGNVVTTADVGPDGKYTVPAGFLLEGESYSIQLSKNKGIIGTPAPAIQLENSWVNVGESAGGSTGNDGTPDGKISIIAGITNFVNYNFGVNNLSDNDGDGIPDYLDLDDDNDGIPDCVERGITGDIDSYFKLNNDATKVNSTTISLTTAACMLSK